MAVPDTAAQLWKDLLMQKWGSLLRQIAEFIHSVTKAEQTLVQFLKRHDFFPLCFFGWNEVSRSESSPLVVFSGPSNDQQTPCCISGWLGEEERLSLGLIMNRHCILHLGNLLVAHWYAAFASLSLYHLHQFKISRQWILAFVVQRYVVQKQQSNMIEHFSLSVGCL